MTDRLTENQEMENLLQREVTNRTANHRLGAGGEDSLRRWADKILPIIFLGERSYLQQMSLED